MKIARLPDGRMLQFPPETADQVVDRVVRQEMGVPEPVNYDQVKVEISVAAVNTLAQVAQTLARIAPALESVSQKIDMAGIGNKLDHIAQETKVSAVRAERASAELSGQMQILSGIVSESANNVVAAYSAPRKLVKSADNRSATLEVDI